MTITVRISIQETVRFSAVGCRWDAYGVGMMPTPFRLRAIQTMNLAPLISRWGALGLINYFVHHAGIVSGSRLDDRGNRLCRQIASVGQNKILLQLG